MPDKTPTTGLSTMTDDQRKAAQQRATIAQMRSDHRRRIVIADEVDHYPMGDVQPLVLLTLLPGAWRDRITVRAWH